MADQPKGINVRMLEYIQGGGTSVDQFALGYQQNGRFGGSTAEKNPDWSPAQRDAYNAGLAARRDDDQLTIASRAD